MAYRRGNRRRTILLLLLLLLSAITLITLDERGDFGAIDTVRDAARDVLAPVQDAVSGVTDPIGDWFDRVVDANDLERENEELKRELAEARGDAAEGEAARNENEELRDLLDLRFVDDVPTVAAEVITASTGNFESTVQIDRGTDDGIAVGMPVVAGDGLVGQVSQASRRRATVLLISDSMSGVGARLIESQMPGVLVGQGNPDDLQLDFIDPEIEVADGELVVTSGVDDSKFPSGIPIGQVVSAERSGGALEQDITVEPLVDLRRLQFVRVMQWPVVGA